MEKIIAILSALIMTGCAGTVTIKTSITGPGGYSLEQEVSGNAEAVLEAASQLLDAELHVKEGQIDVYINSGQEVAGIETKADEVLGQVLGTLGTAVIEKLSSL